MPSGYLRELDKCRSGSPHDGNEPAASRRWLLAESLHEGRRLGKYVQQGQLAQFVLQPRGEEEEEVEFSPRLLSACPLSLTWRRSALLCLLVSYFPVRSTCVEGALGNDPVPL